uniref:Uncharacterized protein n=1 Tax=viral metagenome TaxID=1070528 RepID=A0A6M3M966_9ZZZZ
MTEIVSIVTNVDRLYEYLEGKGPNIKAVLGTLPENTRLVYAVIASKKEVTGIPPALREIGTTLGLDFGGIQRNHIDPLEDSGLIVWPKDENGRRIPFSARIIDDSEIEPPEPQAAVNKSAKEVGLQK